MAREQSNGEAPRSGARGPEDFSRSEWAAIAELIEQNGADGGGGRGGMGPVGGTLASLAGGLGALGLAGAGAQPASAAAQGTIGTPSNRYDWYAEDIDSAGLVAVDELQVGNGKIITNSDNIGGSTTTSADIRADLKDGKIVVYNNVYSDTVDISTTTDPLLEARDLLRNNGDGGKILLPPGGTIPMSSGDIGSFARMSILGARGDKATIEFQDLSANGFLIDGAGADERNFYMDGVVLDGDDLNNRTAGSAIKFESSMAYWNLGLITVRNWPDDAVWTNGGHPFESMWERIYSLDCTGSAVRLGDAGETLHINQIIYGTDTTDYGLHIDGAGGSIVVNELLPRQAQQSQGALLEEGQQNLMLYINHLQYEADNVTIDVPVELNSRGYVKIDTMKVAGTITADYFVQLGFENQRKFIPSIDIGGNNVALNNTKVNIASQPSGPSFYWGFGNEITNSAGSSTGYVRALADAGTGNG